MYSVSLSLWAPSDENLLRKVISVLALYIFILHRYHTIFMALEIPLPESDRRDSMDPWTYLFAPFPSGIEIDSFGA